MFLICSLFYQFQSRFSYKFFSYYKKCVVEFGRGTCYFRKIVCNHARFLNFRADSPLSNSEHQLLEDKIYLWWTYLMILSQESYELYPAGNAIFKVKQSTAKSI